MSPSVVQQFLRRVGRRQKVVSLARQWRFFLLIAVGLYASALLLSRLGGLLPGWFTPATLALLPAIALGAAWLSYRRPDPTEVARRADAQMATHDLFLTASLIDHSLGAYQDLVLNEAERRASRMLPQDVVHYPWQRDTIRVLAALGLLWLGVLLLPQCDPFGFHQRQRQLADQRERLVQTRKAIEARTALLEQKRAGDQAEVVKQAVAELKKALQEARPNDKVATLARLNEQQKLLGQLWKQTSDERLKDALHHPPPPQNFGLADPAKVERWRSDLQKGDVSSASRELDELKQKAQELAATGDPLAREKLRQELMDRLRNLKDTLAQQLNAQSVDADLQRALEQLALAQTPALSGESLKGLCDSLSLTQEELRRLAGSMADIKNLEEALRALQLARTLHNLQPLDGRDFSSFGDLAAYAAFCAGKCRSLNPGPGLGEGSGMGPRPYGDDTAESAFHPEKAASPLQPGRMLMEWKTREVSEAGPAHEDYLRAIQEVRQQASEAVVQEQIPPGYQTAIKKYFDTFHHDTPATSQP
jgi:hypothetical protein